MNKQNLLKLLIAFAAISFACGANAGSVRGIVKNISASANATYAEVVLMGAYAGDAPACHPNNKADKSFRLDISTPVGRKNFEALKAAAEASLSVHIISSGLCMDGREKAGLIVIM